MGIVYDGPYADQVGYEHEGYAARVMPDGTLSGSWGGGVPDDAHIGFRAACGCGWVGETLHPGGDYDGPGGEAALDEWDREHLQPLIDKAAGDWAPWAERVGRLASAVAEHVKAGRLDRAAQAMQDLAGDVRKRERMISTLYVDEQLARQRDVDEHDQADEHDAATGSPADEEWTTDHVLAYLAAAGRPIARSTWEAYVARDQAPAPVRRIGRTPVWSERAVRAWNGGRGR